MLPIFRAHIKKIIKKGIEKIQKNKTMLEENKKEYISDKNILECLENHQRLVENDQIYKIKKISQCIFNWWRLYWQREIQFEERNSKLDA